MAYGMEMSIEEYHKLLDEAWDMFADLAEELDASQDN